MKTENTEDTKDAWHTIQAMKRFGGGFATKLAELYPYADNVNQARIRKAWPEYWATYESMGSIQRIAHGEYWWENAENWRD